MKQLDRFIRAATLASLSLVLTACTVDSTLGEEQGADGGNPTPDANATLDGGSPTPDASTMLDGGSLPTDSGSDALAVGPDGATPDASAQTDSGSSADGASNDAAPSADANSGGADAGPDPCPVTDGSVFLTDPDASIGSVTTDNQFLYWASSTAISRTRISACGSDAPTRVVQTGARSIATDGVTVYWVSGNSPVLACPVTGCDGGAPTSVITNLIPGTATMGVAVDDQYVYTALTQFQFVPDGGLESDIGGGLQLDDGGVYAGTWALLRAPKTGGAAEVIATQLAGGESGTLESVAFAVDGTNLYWVALPVQHEASDQGTVCSKTACAATEQVTQLSGSESKYTVYSVAVDSHAFYDPLGAYAFPTFASAASPLGWLGSLPGVAVGIDEWATYLANGTGQILRAPKPAGL